MRVSATIRWRLGGFMLGIVLAAGLIGWAAHAGWQRVEQLNDDLGQDQLESFRVADQFRAELQRLEGLLLRFEVRSDTNAWAEFSRGQEALDTWLAQQHSRVRTVDEQRVLRTLDDTYDEYRAAAAAVEEAVQHGMSRELVASRIEKAALHFTELGRLDAALVSAHAGAQRTFITESRREVARLQAMLFGALGALLLLGAGVAVFVWRSLITPLRSQLAESQEQLVRHEKLASLGVLAAGVAHEIRNPLTAIKARLFTQRRRLPAGSPAAEDAGVIGAEIDRLERIVRSFLQFGRPADPRQQILPATPLLQKVCDLLAPTLAPRQISLRIESSPEVSLCADPEQLQQVLLNLVQNGADAIGRDGTVTLRALQVHDTGQSATLLEVSDTGPGIPPEVQPRLFDPFFTTKAQGTGLGLSVAARIVEKHGGTIDFVTHAGRGSTFRIRLPSMPAAAPSRAAPAIAHEV